MTPRYLSPSRVSGLGARALFTYLSAVLSQPRIERSPHLRSTLKVLVEDERRSTEVRRRARAVRVDLESGSKSLDRAVAALLEQLAREAEIEPPVPYAAPIDTRSAVRATGDFGCMLPLVAYVPHLRSPFNVGNIIRSAAAFGLCAIVLGSDCPQIDHPRLRRASMGGETLLPVRRGGLEDACDLLADRAVATDPPAVVALEVGGVPVSAFRFPERAVVILGHEELGLSQEHLARARDSGGIVSIPLGGAKRSLNVGVAFGALLSWWSAWSSGG